MIVFWLLPIIVFNQEFLSFSAKPAVHLVQTEQAISRADLQKIPNPLFQDTAKMLDKKLPWKIVAIIIFKWIHVWLLW